MIYTELSTKLEKPIRVLAFSCIRKLQKQYGFDLKEAKQILNLIKGKNPKQFLLPFVGKIKEDCCAAVCYAGGLHIQCFKTKLLSLDYCQKHQLEANKNDHHKPNVGDIRDRLKCPLLDYIDLKKRRTKPYIEIVKKRKMNKEVCLVEAEKAGIIIPQIHWRERTLRRGRPKKEEIIAVMDTDSDDDSVMREMEKTLKADDDDSYVLVVTTNGLVDTELGFVYSKETGEFLGMKS